MSLLSQLERVAPQWRKNGKDSIRYQLVLRYMDEIEEARRRGYSWVQISHGIMKDAVASGLCDPETRYLDVSQIYKQIKKEAAA